jgi:hypothetical protein
MALSAVLRSLSIACLCLTSISTIAQESSQAKRSTVPLTREQIAIYGTFLNNWQAGSKSPLNVANATDSFLPEKDELHGCMKGFPKGSRAIAIHQFPTELADEHIRLINPTEYKVPSMNDLMNQKHDLDDAVEAAVKAGVMSLSEIVFNQDHRLAAFQYSFQCGRLCGTGGTVIYEKRNGQWRRSKLRCGGWVS